MVGSKFNLQSDCGSSPAPCVRFFFSDVIGGLERVLRLRNQFDIASVNMSLGGGIFDSACDDEVPALTTIIKKLSNNNNKIGVVVASGNDGSNDGIGIPACISRAIAVGSTTKADNVSSFSNHHDLVALMAPGSSIRSSVPGGGFAFFNGTSMATPHVAGAWALMKQARPNATVDEVRDAFSITGVDVTRAGVTKPRINVFRAVNRLENVVPTTMAASQ
jgi:subtilisin family serine protease